MNRKSIVGTGIALIATAVIASVATLSVTSKTNADSDIITMKGDTITVSEFYDVVKNNKAAQQVLLEQVITSIFEAKYGSKVTDEEVQKAYEESAKRYGDNFAKALSSAGMTEESYRSQIRTNKLVEYAVSQAAEKELTDEAYKAAYDAYTPEVKAQIIKLADEAKANEVLEKAKAEGADFAQLAKDNSIDTATKEKGGNVTFDSTSTDIPAQLQKAIFALEAGKVGESVVTVVDPQTYATSYYVVKLNEKTEKSDNWKDYQDTLKKAILAQKKADATFITGVVSDELQAANVKVKDQAFQGLLSQYTKTDKTETSSSTSE
ncbi:peptidylprolyl isomerase [Streptococcus merionis]|uniref:Foldase protein PrsA n=1 Tax=Streptococcus merionis TaxID=400065 RepID=A0A239STA4_9STRE|nr:peptidylprolyl isomerase [Streptococcus merionis]SNU88725.1 parvulin-like peptidyl-prolyl isomerase [Streptococcus merionis]